MIRLHYARARKHAFPYGEKNVAGPFETAAEAWEAVKRLRPLYPEADVSYYPQNVGNKAGAKALGGEKIKERTSNGHRT